LGGVIYDCKYNSRANDRIMHTFALTLYILTFPSIFPTHRLKLKAIHTRHNESTSFHCHTPFAQETEEEEGQSK